MPSQHGQQVLLVAQPDLSMCAQVAAALAQSAELMLRLYSLAVHANMQQLASAGTPAAGAAIGAAGGPDAAAAAGQAGAARGGAPGRGGEGRGQGRGSGRGGADMSPAALHNKVRGHTESQAGAPRGSNYYMHAHRAVALQRFHDSCQLCPQ